MARILARRLAVLRWGLLLVLLAIGGALVISAWANLRDAERLSEVLDRAQAERLFRSIPEIHERNRGHATSQDLARVLEQGRADGLCYLVEYDAEGRVLAEAGQRPPILPKPTTALHRVGGRVQTTFHAPPSAPGHPPRPAAGEPPTPRPPPGGGPPPPRREALPDLVMEFEPTVSNQLVYRATSNLAFSIAAAVALAAVTIGLWLSISREERERERRERERHLASLGEMSAVLAHEIRNPLASLKGHAQLLAEQVGEGSPHQKKVARIVTEAKRLEELTRSLLDLVRSSSITREATDPVALLRNAAAAVDAQNVVLDTASAPSSWQLDPMRMDQVFRNLLQNAAQASPSNAPIEASVAVERGELGSP